MPPQIVGYNPNRGIEAIAKAGKDISGLLSSIHAAELSYAEKQREQQAVQFLGDVIQRRQKETGNQLLGAVPMLDPVVQQAALMAAPHAKDFVEILAGFSDKNLGAIRATSVPNGYVALDPATGEFKYTRTKEDTQKDGDMSATSTIFANLGIKGIKNIHDIALLSVMQSPKIRDEKGNIDPSKLANEVIGVEKSIAVGTAGAVGGVREAIEAGSKEKAGIKKAKDDYGAAFAKLKTAGIIHEDQIRDILSGNIYMAGGDPNAPIKFPRPEFSALVGGKIGIRPEVQQFIDAWSKLPEEDRALEARRYGADTVASPADTSGAPADATKSGAVKLDWNTLIGGDTTETGNE